MVEALIYTILIQAAVVIIKWLAFSVGNFLSLGPWTEGVELVWSVVLAVSIALFWAQATNNDTIHRILRAWGITHQTSYESEWYGVLAEGGHFVVLHLPGSRRLYGWPEEFPSSPSRGHFVIVAAEWLDRVNPVTLPMENKVVIPASVVEFLELVPKGGAQESEPGGGAGPRREPMDGGT